MRHATSTLLVAAIYLAAAGLSRGQTAPGLRDALALEAAMQAAIREVEPAIACILVSRNDAYRRLYRDVPPSDQPGRLGGFFPGRAAADVERRLNMADPGHVPESYGSGVVIGATTGVESRLLVLTNFHVVRDATKVFVRLPGDRASYADIHAADARSDLAVLRLANANVPPVKPVKFGDGGALRKGQWILTVANPFAAGFRDGSPSASWGIVSNLRRRPPTLAANENDPRAKTLHEFGTLIQTDARLNLGCSGGALINLQGEMVGLTTALAALSGGESSGGFAVPMDKTMKGIVGKLREGKEVEYGFLGVEPQNLGARAEGVLLKNVSGNSPAQRAGLIPNDLIVAVDGFPVRENDDLFFRVGSALADSTVEVKYVRSGGFASGPREQSTSVTLAKYLVSGKVIASNRPAPVKGVRVDQTSLLLQQRTFYRGAPPGVLVTEVASDSPAAAAGIKTMDIITHVNGVPVDHPRAFYQEGGRPGPIELTLMASDPSKLPPKVRLD